jgi:hypothetical protein
MRPRCDTTVRYAEAPHCACGYSTNQSWSSPRRSRERGEQPSVAGRPAGVSRAWQFGVPTAVDGDVAGHAGGDDEPGRQPVHGLQAVRFRRHSGRRGRRYGTPEPHAFVSRATVCPPGPPEHVGALLEAHAAAGIELRLLPNLWPYWTQVMRSTLGFRGPGDTRPGDANARYSARF